MTQPVDPFLEKLKLLHLHALEVQKAAHLLTQEAGRREAETRRHLHRYLRERGFCPTCESPLTHCKGHSELDFSQIV